MLNESSIRATEKTTATKLLKLFHSLSPELQQTILSFFGGVADAIACFKRDGPFSRLQYLCWGFPDTQNPTVLGIFGLRGQPWWDQVSDTDAAGRHAFTFPSTTSEEKPFSPYDRPMVSIRELCSLLEANVEVISQEFEQLRSSAADGVSYQERLKTSSDSKGDWKVLYLMDEGVWGGNSAMCPVTHSLLQQLPVCACSFGYVYFSVLSAHTYIDPHCGVTNAKLRLQLPLVSFGQDKAAFSDCFVVVNGEERRYVPGQAIVFDDSFTHSVRNHGDSERVVLLVDLWHPALPAASIAQISSCFNVLQTAAMVADVSDEGHFHKFPISPTRGQPMAPSYDHRFKFLVIGSHCAGKSSFITRWVGDTFTDRYSATIGVDFSICSQKVRNCVVLVQIWDTTGLGRNCTITSALYRSAQVILLLVDTTKSQADFCLDVDYHIDRIHTHANETATTIVVGTKVDLMNSRQVLYEDARDFVSTKGCEYFECSSKTGVGVRELMYHAMKACLLKAADSDAFLRPVIPPYSSASQPSCKQCGLS